MSNYIYAYDIIKQNLPCQSNKLRKKLLAEGIKQPICEACNLSKWQGKNISLELDHIDGNKHNNLLSNLRLLCPNCHAQTEYYRGRNTRKYRERMRHPNPTGRGPGLKSP